MPSRRRVASAGARAWRASSPRCASYERSRRARASSSGAAASAAASSAARFAHRQRVVLGDVGLGHADEDEQHRDRDAGAVLAREAVDEHAARHGIRDRARHRDDLLGLPIDHRRSRVRLACARSDRDRARAARSAAGSAGSRRRARAGRIGVLLDLGRGAKVDHRAHAVRDERGATAVAETAKLVGADERAATHAATVRGRRSRRGPER